MTVLYYCTWLENVCVACIVNIYSRVRQMQRAFISPFKDERNEAKNKNKAKKQ